MDRITEVVIHDRERQFSYEFPSELGIVELKTKNGLSICINDWFDIDEPSIYIQLFNSNGDIVKDYEIKYADIQPDGVL